MGTDVYLSFCWPIFDIRYISVFSLAHVCKSKIFVWNFCTLKNKYCLTLQVLFTSSDTSSHTVLQMEHSLGVKNFFFPPLSPHVKAVFFLIPCLPVLSTPLSYVCCVCMDRLMANFAGTCTSDNKGLLLLLLLLCQSCTHCLRNIRTS